MKNLLDLHLTAKTLERYGLPNIAYSITMDDFFTAIDDNVELPLASMLYGLQQRSRDGEMDWQEMEPSMVRLAQLLSPDDNRQLITAASENWWLEIGPVDLNGKVVTIQRGGYLIAALAAREDGRLRIAVFRPLDGKSAEYLLNLGIIPQPDGGVCMRENNWEYALDCSAGMGNNYASMRGEAYISFWEKGVGIRWDGSEEPKWHPQRNLIARQAAHVAMELGVYYTFTPSEDDE
jgi:hypothetical protein